MLRKTEDIKLIITPQLAAGRAASLGNKLSQERSGDISKKDDGNSNRQNFKFFRDRKPLGRSEDGKKFLKIASLNTQGNEVDECIRYMKNRGIDILFIQEAKVPTSSFFSIGDDYFCVTSTDLPDMRKTIEV